MGLTTPPRENKLLRDLKKATVGRTYLMPEEKEKLEDLNRDGGIVCTKIRGF
jgi:hypothetical protein